LVTFATASTSSLLVIYLHLPLQAEIMKSSLVARNER
jgi:hypothetical protein